MKIMNKLEAQFMILGIGTDILNINRIRSTVMNPKDPFVKRVFTLREQKKLLIHIVKSYIMPVVLLGKRPFLNLYP